MNWLDFVILVILAVGAILGMRTGLIGAAVAAAGAFVGWILAGQLADKLSNAIGSVVPGDALVSVISYALIIVLALVVTRLAWKFLRPVLSAATLGMAGMVDTMGGIVLGALVGFAIASAVILGMARFSYNLNLPDEGIAGRVVDVMPYVDETRTSVENALTESRIVPAFVNITNSLPGNVLGFVPPDFKVSLQILKQNIEG